MDLAIISFCLAAVLSNLIQVSSHYGTYRGAVVEFSPDIGGASVNVRKYLAFMEEAAQKRAEIIVFPEGGLLDVESSPIPDPVDRIAPCDSLTFQTTQTVKDLSRGSKVNNIYSVVNLREKRNCAKDDKNCPSQGYYIFNTNVVFDRSGTVIARYAKYNLFEENNINRTIDPELVFFDTDFGVRFGTFTCFDILFSAPAQRLVQQYGIKDFVFPTFWFSELPFLTALQAQRGWAETNNANLLASGVNWLSRGSTGSGIYNGKFGELVQFMAKSKTSKLLIADIPVFKNNWSSDVIKREMPRNISAVIEPLSTSHFSAEVSQKTEPDSSLELLEDQINRYTSEVIEKGTIFERTVCSANDFCCDFYVNMDDLIQTNKSDNYVYRAVAFNGIRLFGSFKGGVQSCGVVLCDGPDIRNCTKRVKAIPGLFKFKEIRIKGNFNLRNSMQIPSTLTDGEEIIPLPATKYEFTKTVKGKKMEVSLELLWPVYDLHTFAIFGRDFTRDLEPAVPESSAPSLVSTPVLFGAFLTFVLFAR